MKKQEAYMILDIGTGNVRVAIASPGGEVLGVERDNVRYEQDTRYPEALSFNPDELWEQIQVLAGKVMQQVPDITITAVTASSQREGVVLLGQAGESLTGLPNHDHRGREWEHIVPDKDRVYKLAGRYPTSLFSALKLVGIRERRPELHSQVAYMVSISDWAQFKLSGIIGYEHSQASETLLYDVAGKRWSEELCGVFGIDSSILPELRASGTIIGHVLPECATRLGISSEAVVVVGGADTQLAIKSTQPAVEDIVIVSGTTTPVIKVVKEYLVDEQERTWTNRHIDEGSFILETNAGVTGLNYQRLKDIFYPNESYQVMEEELAAANAAGCVASLGSLIAHEKSPLTRGGFVFNAPVSHQLSRASFVKAALWDIACCIKENYDDLCDVTGYEQDYIWACGGGMQSAMLRQLLADLTGKKVLIRQGFQQASVVGGALVCNQALGREETSDTAIEETHPQQHDYAAQYKEWKKVRNSFRVNELEEVAV